MTLTYRGLEKKKIKTRGEMKFCKAEGQSKGLPLAPNLSQDSV